MSIGVLDAVSAYGRRQKSVGSAGGGAAGSAGFGGMVENVIAGTADALKTAEAASARQVAGKGDLVDVATAIGAAEMALDTVVAVRDRVVNAYTEIMRMQI